MELEDFKAYDSNNEYPQRPTPEKEKFDENMVVMTIY